MTIQTMNNGVKNWFCRRPICPTVDVEENPERHGNVDVHENGELAAVFAVDDLSIRRQQKRQLVSLARNTAHVLVHHPILFSVWGCR